MTAFRRIAVPLGGRSAKSIVVARREASLRHAMEPPHVVKHGNGGSSVSVFIIRKSDNRLPGELGSELCSFGESMVEEFIPGRKRTVAVMGDRARGVTEIVPRTASYDYEAKYAPGDSHHVVPARTPERIAKETMNVAVRAHQARDCRGVRRTDFRFDESANRERLILLEVDTQPGMTPTSLVPEQARHIGMDFRPLVRWIAEDASCDR